MKRCKVLAVCCLLSLASCGLFNDPPEITRVTMDYYEHQPWTSCVVIDEEVIFSVVAYDKNGDELTDEWSADGGTFADKSEGYVCWQAPADYGEYNIHLEVTDKHDAMVSWDTLIKVVTIEGKIWKQFGVNPEENQVLSDTLPAGWHMKGRLELTSNEIDLLILDEANYGEWDQGNAYQVADSIHGSGLDYFGFDVVETEVYYFVLDNNDTLRSEGWLEVLVVSP